MIDLLEKLIETDFEDTFKPHSKKELKSVLNSYEVYIPYYKKRYRMLDANFASAYIAAMKKSGFMGEFPNWVYIECKHSWEKSEVLDFYFDKVKYKTFFDRDDKSKFFIGRIRRIKTSEIMQKEIDSYRQKHGESMHKADEKGWYDNMMSYDDD